MIIDFHTHVGDHRTPERMDRLPVTWEGLIERLDSEGIDKAVVLPSGVSPESMKAPFLFSPQVDIIGQLKAAQQYQDRIISFGNLDPRMGCLGNLEPHQVENPPETDFSWILARFRELGCVGIGEITANIAVDDPRVISLFRQCGNFDLPVLFHCTGPGRGVYGLYDEVGLPRLERLLQAVPDTTVIGHAPGFWAEIEGDITAEKKFVYPTGPIRTEGSLSRLLRSYPNLYADISANSGFNAISRDKAFGVDFLTEFQDKILFGTDVCFGGQDGRMPHLGYLRGLLEENQIAPRVFAKITGENALKILKLYSSDSKPSEEKS
ncbi:MAG: amidohydrolase family protein [Spirochaetia bacterium]|jgi:predicted TIM-barrel fold metal-dependent hydrolase|nr:amidohydrolase family protein [Spirochaetales bacterium]